MLNVDTLHGLLSHCSFSSLLTQTLKKQEQTVKDLRQTLQRELKVQALPNDDASDDNSNVPSPSTGRRFPPRQAVPPRSVSPQLPSADHSLPVSSSAVLSVSSSSTSSATAAVKPMTMTQVMQVSGCGCGWGSSVCGCVWVGGGGGLSVGVHMCACLYAYVFPCWCACVCVCACVYVCVCECMHVCVHAFVCACTCTCVFFFEGWLCAETSGRMSPFSTTGALVSSPEA